MEKKQINDISEKQVEDALVTNLDYLKKILDVPDELKLIARQLRIKDDKQRIDLLVSSGSNLCLIELKVVEFSTDHLEQIIEYKKELIKLQEIGKLLSGRIICYLMVTDASKKQIEMAEKNDVDLIKYKPIEVLTNYFNTLSGVAPFLKIKPNDYGVMNICKINYTLLKLREGLSTEKEIALELNLSKGSISHHFRLGREFGLVRKRKSFYALTDLGDLYCYYLDDSILKERLSFEQIELLKKFIAEDPFYSSTVFGIFCIVESAFLLSRNTYPIRLNSLQKMFQIVGGKLTEWNSTRSLTTATYTFLNFATDLELLGKIGQQIVITPSGFRFILMLQLHKSIEMIESLSIR